MEKALSQGEIDALFRAARSATGTGTAEDKGTRVAASDLARSRAELSCGCLTPCNCSGTPTTPRTCTSRVAESPDATVIDGYGWDALHVNFLFRLPLRARVLGTGAEGAGSLKLGIDGD
jgi:hypothetical protein